MLHLDFETRSPVDLRKLGADVYFSDERTRVLCMAWALHDFEVALWIPGQPFPREVIQHIENGGDIAAHNAAFERGVFEYGLLPDEVPLPRLEQWVCTATLCRARGLPGELEMAAYALGGEFQKDPRGKALIKACCIEPGCSDERLPELYEYCKADTAAERGLAELLPPPTEEERQLHVAAERINDRGVGVDRDFCIAAGRYRDREMREINEQLLITTDGAVKTAQAKQAAQKWVIARYPDAEELRDPKRKSGYSLDKHHLGMFAARDDLDDDTRYVVELLQDGANTSVSKYDAMLARSESTGRVHGAYVTNAAHTGRFSSKGAQLHNFKRDVPKDWQEKMDAVRSQSLREGVMGTLASLLRPTITANPGNALGGGDWSGIEARITAWLGDAHEVLAIFADPKRDLYQEQASSMGYEDRQVGKVAVLACGFGGMGNAFVAMARNYGLHVSKALGDVYGKAWRDANPWAQRLWTAVERAAVNAMRNPGTPFGVSRGVAFATYDRWLCCQLPSGRVLYYLDPKLEVGKYGTWQLSYRKPQYISPSIPGARARTWGGTLTENIVQAIAADLLRRALITLDHDNYLQVVGHVHDEIIGETLEECIEERIAYLSRVMLDAPEWAAGLPLAVETWHGKRYV
jgi:DNA polymerase bacteriophage-type